MNITNHSGAQVTGPNPKYTYDGGSPVQACGGGTPPPVCERTFGYWSTPGSVDQPHTWPTTYNDTTQTTNTTTPTPYQTTDGNTTVYGDGSVSILIDHSDQFFNSGMTWDDILATPVSGSGYLNLAHQWIGAVLNVANGAADPSSVTTYIDEGAVWFSTFPAGSDYCPSGGAGANCSLQVTWAGILTDYNQATGAYSPAAGFCSQ